MLFDIKFISLHENIGWQNGYSITQRLLQPDGRWHTVRIPLMDMHLWGGWNDVKQQSVDIQGRAISWVNVTGLQFVSVQENGIIQEIYLDDIKVVR